MKLKRAWKKVKEEEVEEMYGVIRQNTHQDIHHIPEHSKIFLDCVGGLDQTIAILPLVGTQAKLYMLGHLLLVTGCRWSEHAGKLYSAEQRVSI